MIQSRFQANAGTKLRPFLHRFHQYWRTWRQRIQARNALRKLNNDRLEDIGLTRRDVDNLW